jgi:hypothetical protein
MNESSNPNPSQPNGSNQPQDTPNPSSEPGSKQTRCPFESLCSAIDEGARDAKASAEKALPKIKAAISGVTYWLGYGVSFAVVFSYRTAKELAPEALKAGCRDGAQAGQRAAENLASKFKTPSHSTDAAQPPNTDPTSPTPQPGVA